MYPIILLLYATPQATILPLFVLVFGIGAASKIAFGVSHGMFPILMTVAAGVQNIPPILLTSARSMGANRRQILTAVVFPHLVPSFFTGLRLGITAVLFGVAAIRALHVSQSSVNRPLHHRVHPNLSAAEFVRAGRGAGDNCGNTERALPLGGIAIHALASRKALRSISIEGERFACRKSCRCRLHAATTKSPAR